MPVLEKMPTETLRRSVAASVKSTSKRSDISRSLKEAADKTMETTAQQEVVHTLTEVRQETVETTKAEAIQEAQVCWIATKLAPYHPDQQVELLHLQAEVDALLIKLQAQEQRRICEKAAL